MNFSFLFFLFTLSWQCQIRIRYPKSGTSQAQTCTNRLASARVSFAMKRRMECVESLEMRGSWFLRDKFFSIVSTFKCRSPVMLKSVEFINCRIGFVKLSFNILCFNYIGLSIISYTTMYIKCILNVRQRSTNDLHRYFEGYRRQIFIFA